MPRSCQHVGVHAGLEHSEIHQLDLGPANAWYREYHDAAGPAPPEMGAVHVRTPRSWSAPGRCGSRLRRRWAAQPCPWTWQHRELPRRRPFFRRRLPHQPFAPAVVGSARTEQPPPKPSSSRHVDEDDEDLARVNAGSGSHNFDAAYLACQRCRGTDPRAPMGPAGRVPFGSAGAEIMQRADRGEAHERFTQVRAARMRKTLLLLCGLY